MNQLYEALTLVDNAYDRQLELALGEYTAFIQYELHEHLLVLVHTEVPTALQGQGVGSTLVEKVLHYAADHQLTVVPLCPFVARYLRLHPDWYRVVAPGYRPVTTL